MLQVPRDVVWGVAALVLLTFNIGRMLWRRTITWMLLI
jgi:hypothetical protein